MNADEVTQALTFIELSWPRDWPTDWEQAWRDPLLALPTEPTLQALKYLQVHSTFPPSVADLHLAVAKELGQIPPDPEGIAGEEWAKKARNAMYANRDLPPAPHPAIRKAISAFGGIEDVMDDRNAWRRFWKGWRAERIEEAVQPQRINEAYAAMLNGAATVDQIGPG